jgi:hypothetical protein
VQHYFVSAWLPGAMARVLHEGRREPLCCWRHRFCGRWRGASTCDAVYIGPQETDSWP